MRLLLAEDERELSDALYVLLKHNNYSVDTVYNGEDAIEYLSSGDYDGVILDIMMPKVDGMEVLRRIREKGNNVPVLILTAKDDVEDKCKGLDAGADDYLTKPFAVKELLSRIKSITRRKGEVKNDVITYSSLSLDRSTFELISVNGRETLNHKEFQIMELFMNSPEKIISTAILTDKVWGFDSDADIGVVWVYISYLRKKINNVGASVSIKAVRNVGYIMEADDD